MALGVEGGDGQRVGDGLRLGGHGPHGAPCRSGGQNQAAGAVPPLRQGTPRPVGKLSNYRSCAGVHGPRQNGRAVSSSEWFGAGGPPHEEGRPTPSAGAGRPGGRWGGGRTMFGRRRGPLGPTIAILVALGFFGSLAASVWSDVLWFDSLGFRTVFVTELTTKILLFTVGAVLTGALVASSLVIGYRSRPVYAPVTTQQQNLDQYREAIEPAAPPGHDRHPHRPGPAGRRRRRRPVADVPAVAQPGERSAPRTRTSSWTSRSSCSPCPGCASCWAS